MQVLSVLFKLALLMLGAAMLIGGGLVGLCGVIEGSGEVFMMGFLPGMLGLMLFIGIVGSLKTRRKDEAPAPTDSGDREP